MYSFLKLLLAAALLISVGGCLDDEGGDDKNNDGWQSPDLYDRDPIVVEYYAEKSGGQYVDAPCGTITDISVSDGTVFWLAGSEGLCQLNFTFEIPPDEIIKSVEGSFRKFDRHYFPQLPEFVFGGTKIYRFDRAGEKVIELPLVLAGEVYDLIYDETTLFIATSAGLYSADPNSEAPSLTSIFPESVTAIFLDPKDADVIWALNPQRLVKISLSNNGPPNIETRLEAIRDEQFRDLFVFKDGEIVIAGSDGPIDLAPGADPYRYCNCTGPPIRDLHRIFYAPFSPPRNAYDPDNFPYPPEATAAGRFDDLYYGTPHGLISRSGRDLYHSKRFFPDDFITAFRSSAANDHSALLNIVATKTGLGLIFKDTSSLEKKALSYEQMLRDRHDRFGMNASAILGAAGDLSTSYTHDDDNDGQWTQMAMAAQCYRFAATGDPESFAYFSRQLEAMLRLATIAPIDGFPARSVLPPDGCPSRANGPGEWHLSEDESWCWKGDTSSDELVGHFYGFSICRDIAANEEQRAQIDAALEQMAEHLVDNNFYLLDLDGEPTTHGDFNPDFLNSPIGQLGDAGLNSAMVLGFLLTAYQFTGREKFLEAYDYLVEEHAYDENVRRLQEINQAVQFNHDSDEMAYMAMFTLIRYEQRPELRAKYLEGLSAMHQTQIPEHNPEFNIQYLVYADEIEGGPDRQQAFDDALKTMLEIPFDLLDWLVDNSYRVDYTIDDAIDRHGQMQFTEAPPADERVADRWAENPYQVTRGGEGRKEEVPTLYLLPYWMGRYYRFWE